MINYFRRIRKRLARENEFQKYSRYAIGEIVLVVLGILIALQLNNWNEGQKEEKQFYLEDGTELLLSKITPMSSLYRIASRQLSSISVAQFSPSTTRMSGVLTVC